jgi:hypothetical protein
LPSFGESFPFTAPRPAIGSSSSCRLRNELRSVKGELERAKEHVKQYQVIAETQGVSLQEVTATYEEYKTAMDAATAEKDVSILGQRARESLELIPSFGTERTRQPARTPSRHHDGPHCFQQPEL